MIDAGLRRRAFLRGLLASALTPATGFAAGDSPRDQGIGGTGMSAAPPADGDRGIGGTGVFGTIRRFGSIVVNGLRIAYPPDVRVEIDGRPATLGDLRLGHVVAVDASGARDHLSTDTIRVEHEVVGPIQSVDGRTLSILGQTVQVAGKAPAFEPGDWVAVSGIRRLDGAVAASLVEAASPGLARVAGPLVARDGGYAVSGLTVTGMGAAFAGQRALIEGTLRGSEFVPASVSADPAANVLAAARVVSIEAYVARSADGLRLGSGQFVEGGRSARSFDGHAFVSGQVGPGGQIRATAVGPARGGLDGSGPQRAPAGQGPGRSGPGPGPRSGGPGGPSSGPSGLQRGGQPGRPPGGDLPTPNRGPGGPGGAGHGSGSGGTPGGGSGPLRGESGGFGRGGIGGPSGAPGPGGFGEPGGGFGGPGGIGGPGGFGAPGGFGGAGPGGFGGRR